MEALQFRQPERIAAKPSVSLSKRQVQVLRLIATGASTKEVAANLGVSYKTADHHRARLMKRIDAREIAAVVHYAIRYGFVAID